jgi:hypothetical protein
MSVDHIRYDLLVRDALRSVVRRVVADVARNGLPGDHHFFIVFDTCAPGVRISSRLRERYPQEMTVVLQHQFWDLAATETGIEVGLSFNGNPEKLVVPYESIKSFFDPSVKFGLEFEVAAEGHSAEADGADGAQAVGSPAIATREPVPASDIAFGKVVGASDEDEPPKPDGGAEVVRLDRFRKK